MTYEYVSLDFSSTYELHSLNHNNWHFPVLHKVLFNLQAWHLYYGLCKSTLLISIKYVHSCMQYFVLISILFSFSILLFCAFVAYQMAFFSFLKTVPILFFQFDLKNESNLNCDYSLSFNFNNNKPAIISDGSLKD